MLNPTFVVASASFGLHSRSECPIPLIKFADNEFLYSKQIKAIRQVWPNADIIYITGFNCDKIDPLLKKEHISVIHNLDYEKTTICHSLNKVFKKYDLQSVFLIYGNVFFDREVLTNSLKNVIVDAKKSQGLLLTSFSLNKKNLGIGPNGYFDNAFEEKWAKIGYFNKEFCGFLKEDLNAHPYYCFEEILNNFSANELYFDKIDIRNNHLLDIKQAKDVKFINEHFLGKKYAK